MNYKPSRRAVALEYGKRKAPVMTAKGQGEAAQLIIEEAKKQGIHIAEDPQLVALLGQLELNEEIPESLYVAVSIILSWVYWLKGMEPGDEQGIDNNKV
ncbi:EscU/YscU/HrcU family type III secretion system export apparatus switch protein [SAR92 clade bacterium H455]|uniref:Flagellar biosynthetic protein FlhB n=1 Tax=SAR92 clade bacterium H455 TaxID=2974818 RepID=A0ABY5TMX5_9GAMM|nr:EscU/YscU/HrcU family type III secretion system export apparatus switch protein [SAR92 clade bacterium H455]